MRCMMAMGDIIDVADLPENIHKAGFEGDALTTTAAEPEKDMSLEDQERRLLVSALERANGNQSQAARLLRISRDRMRYKMAKHHLK